MVLAITKEIDQLFQHSRRVNTGIGIVRIGQATRVVALDGTGDFDTLEEAITDLPEGGVIYVKEGTYVIKNKITISAHGLTITGAGRSTVIYTEGDIRLLEIVGDYFVIDNVYLKGNDTGANQIGIFMTATSTDSIIRNCWITNFNDTGIVLLSDDTIISNCFVTDIGESGISVDTNDNSITNCVIRDNGDWGIEVSSGTGLICSGNIITGNGESGIISSGDEGIFSGNSCIDNLDHGIEIDSGDYNVVTSNALRTNTNAGLAETGTGNEIGHNVE